MEYFKYHGDGDSYIVSEPHAAPIAPTSDEIKAICDKTYGVGSDGLLFGPLTSRVADYGFRIFNPDGSEAEKSGVGTRVMARHVSDRGLVLPDTSFSLETKGGIIKEVIVFEAGRMVQADMGTVSFSRDSIPVNIDAEEVLNQEITVDNRTFLFSAATIGNPHCVIFVPETSTEIAKHFGPLIENHPYFPNRTNVQFVSLRENNRADLDMEIWERGAGYTTSSGTSSCAAAAVARRLGFCDENVSIHTPGGTVNILVRDDFSVQITGSVTKVSEGTISKEIFNNKT
jgi:diaminopimelate epimerase